MSYTIKQRHAQFFLNKAGLEPARKAIVAVMSSFDWFKKRNALTLEAAAAQCGWALEFDDNDNVIGIEHLNSYEGQEKLLFGAMAPYVKPGSFIEMAGEDGDFWRWYFTGEACKEVKPTVVWQGDV